MKGVITWVLLLVIGAGFLVEANGTPASAMLDDSELAMMSASVEMPGEEKPDRPKFFSSPDQIKVYLDGLGKYYNFHNRNRFGKRGDPGPIFPNRGPPVSNGFRDYDSRSPF